MLKTNSKYNFQVFGYFTLENQMVYNRHSAYSLAIGKCRRLNDVNSEGGKFTFIEYKHL